MRLLLRGVPAALWFVACCAYGFVDALVRGGDLSSGHRFARLCSRGAQALLGVRVDVRGLEHLEAYQPCVYVANHQSHLDVLFHGAVFPPRTLVIAKKQVLWIPFFGVMFAAGRHLVLDRARRDAALVQMGRALEAMQQRGASIWLFPEGTRGKGTGMLPFKKGAFRLAIASGRPLVPLVLGRLSDRVDVRRLHLSPGRLELRVLEPVDPTPYPPESVDELIAEVRRRMVEAWTEMGGAGD